MTIWLILKPIIISAVVLGIICYAYRKNLKEDIQPMIRDIGDELDRMIDKVNDTTDTNNKGEKLVTDENYTDVFDSIGDKLEANDFNTDALTEEESKIITNCPCKWMIYHNERYIAEERRKREAHPELYVEGQEG